MRASCGVGVVGVGGVELWSWSFTESSYWMSESGSELSSALLKSVARVGVAGGWV